MAYVTFEALHSAAHRSHRPKPGSDIDSAHSPKRVSEPPPPPTTTSPPPLSPRTEVLRVASLVGSMCASILAHAPLDPPRDVPSPEMEGNESFPPTLADSGFWSEESGGRDEIAAAMGAVFLALFVAAGACGLDLRTCVLKKMELNGRKYPVELCKGKSGKYTAYSDQTGITKTDGQSTVHLGGDRSFRSSSGSDSDSDSGSRESGEAPSSPGLDTVDGVTLRIRRFATDRSWSRYHTPRNVALALLGELGELAELFQWKGDARGGAPAGLVGWSEGESDAVGQELADVSIYLMRLADVCGVELGREALRAAVEPSLE